MPSTIIVTASDRSYFDLLRGLLLSIEAQRGGHAVSIGLLDLGLTAEQRDWAEPRVTEIVSPGWDLDVPEALRREKPFLRGCTVRPFLPQHFPGHDTYLWIDADVWLQNWRGVELYSLGAQNSDLTVAPHTDRAYPYDATVHSYRYERFELAYGKAAADEIAPQQHMNAGIFAARADSPLWAHWAESYGAAIDASGGTMMSDQIALNFACYRQNFTAHLLSALYNWQSHLSVPIWNPKTEQFCEPHLPHEPISMLHLTHTSKDMVYDIRCLGEQPRRMTLRNPQAASSALPSMDPNTNSNVTP